MGVCMDEICTHAPSIFNNTSFTVWTFLVYCAVLKLSVMLLKHQLVLVFVLLGGQQLQACSKYWVTKSQNYRFLV